MGMWVLSTEHGTFELNLTKTYADDLYYVIQEGFSINGYRLRDAPPQKELVI
jgi:hypothetical protein